MTESIIGKAALVLGVLLPLVIGVTAWLAKRDGIRISWFRVAIISAAVFVILAVILFSVASSRFGNQDAIMFTLFGTVTACLAVTWAMTRKRRQGKSNT